MISLIAILSVSFSFVIEDAQSLRDSDRDYDGIVDEDDECPQLSETFNKFEDEDGCPDTVIEEKTKYEFPDSDGDGIEDRLDKCVNLPETFNAYLDHDGCPERVGSGTIDSMDSDFDSVPDSIDACPTEKETINEFKDGDGCPDSFNSSYSKTHDFDDGECRGEKIGVMRIHTNDIVCVDLDTAEKWEKYGLGEILVKSEPAEGNLIVSGAEVMEEIAKSKESTQISGIQLPPYPDQPTVNPDFDAHTANFWPPEIIKVTEGVWQATGYGLANSIMIEGEDGIIIVDAMMSHESATEVMEEFRKITDKPVKAIVYTHSHPDHINGAGAFAQYADDDLEIFAHSTFLDNYYHESGELGKIIATRGLFYYGVFLPQDGPDRFVSTGIGPFLETGDVSTSFIVPTTTFEDRLEVEVAGMKMVLIHTPSETNDEIVVWFPETQVLVGSEVLYKLWPNLYSIRGTSYRDVKSWTESLQTMIDLDAKYLALSHTQPVIGSENVKEVLTAYHDGVQYVYDQTIRGINNGMTVDELVNTIDLPPSLKDHPWLQERYGERSWHIRGIYSGNIGWYQGDSAFLNPISSQEQSSKIVEGFGGIEKTIEKVRDAIDKGEYEWAAMLASYIIEAEPENKEAKLLKAFSLRVLGQQAHSSGARNWYLTDALVLEEKVVIDPSVVALTSPETIAATPIEILLEQVPTRLDPTKAEGLDMLVGLELSDSDESFTFHVRNSIAALTPELEENLDVKLIAEESTIKLTLAGQKMLEDSINDGTITVEGNLADAMTFISLFDPYVQASLYAN